MGKTPQLYYKRKKIKVKLQNAELLYSSQQFKGELPPEV